VINVGDRIPEATFTTMTSAGPRSIGASEVFSGKWVVVFGVPGAFTPTCSRQHLPSYLKNHDAIRAQGVQTIACVAVNDVFVMDAWFQANGVGDRILMLADGNGDFTRRMGLDVDVSSFGMGTRSRRYAMVVEDGVIRELNIETEGEFRVSSAEFTCKL
jgi:peroxiredoxin